MKSIDKLREYTNGDALRAGMSLRTARDDILAYIDAIEREVADMVPLPLDADGVPWRVGDMTENGNVVNGMTIDFHGWHFTGTRNDIDPAIHRHYVPKPTVEDVLREFGKRWHDAKRGEMTFDYDELIAEYAARLQLKEG